MALSDAEVFRELKAGGRHLLAEFPGFTEAQRLAIPDLLERRSVLLIARTASGKTEAVLAPLLTLLAKERWPGRPSILYVAPTRALVNDLHARLAGMLSGFVDVGRRTGEYREPDSQLLITTPESLDSMLVRGWKGEAHLLRNVRAIVLDELHLLAESARGTQLQVLLSRLDRIAGDPVLRIGLSATVPDPAGLAARFLGPEAVVRIGTGSRALEIDRCQGVEGIPPRGEGPDPLAKRFLRASDAPDGYQGLAERLVELRTELGGLKALVFVPSRSRCDRLSGTLASFMQGRVPLQVHAHHGSLDKGYRENTEQAMSESAEAIAVATSTLEVGIDIGDVGLVVLDGPPGSVGSLLQRIGRGNRRSNKVFVVPVVRNDVEAVTLASMLRSAMTGELDPCPETAHYSVAIQQLASILRQARGRPLPERVVQLLAGAFGDRAPWILEELIKAGWLELGGDGRLVPCLPLAELMDQPMRLHANIGGGGRVVPLIDAVTGEALAWIPPGALPAKIVVAGASYAQRDRGDAVELSNGSRDGSGAAVRYASRGAPIGRTALRHLARGLGLPVNALVLHGGRFYHFGGALFSRLLKLAGMTSDPLSSAEDPRKLAELDFATLAASEWETLEWSCGFGPFQRELPDSVRAEAVSRTVGEYRFEEWLRRMDLVTTITAEQAAILAQA